MPSLVAERIESVKAGIFGAGAFTVAELVFFVAQEMTQGVVLDFLPELKTETITLDWSWGISLAIGTVSGFLFGVTYRYVIRSDRNSHLNDGAVLAFGLVRGLALVEKNLALLDLSKLLSIGGLVLQSIVCFAIARLILDLAIARKLIKPFI
ncbi:MAG: hypothetical protein RLZZ74_10 [Cyanobacteriota bacterium]